MDNRLDTAEIVLTPDNKNLRPGRDGPAAFSEAATRPGAHRAKGAPQGPSRQRDIGITDRVEIDACPDPPGSVDHLAYSVVRDANHRQSLLNGARPSAGEVLKRTRAAAVPSVVREIQYPVGPLPFIDNRTRENGLVAYRRGKRRKPRQRDRAKARTGAEIDRAGGYFLEGQNITKRDVLAKRN